MIEKNKQRLTFWSNLKRDLEGAYGKDYTREDVLDYLLGDDEGWSGSDYVVYQYKEKSGKSFMNRVNHCWVWPLFLITIPFQWLFTGSFGVNRNSKLGRIIDWLVKFE